MKRPNGCILALAFFFFSFVASSADAHLYEPIVSDVSVGKLFACATDDEGVKCWKQAQDATAETEFLPTPELKAPTSIATGDGFACAIAEASVHCWSWDSHGSLQELSYNPANRNPKLLRAGGDYVCAIDDSGLWCWNPFGTQWRSIYLIEHPTDVAVGKQGMCAIGDEGAVCWAWDFSWRKVLSKPEKHPRMVTIGSSPHGYVLDDDGVHEGNGINRESFNDPVQFTWGFNSASIYSNAACVIEREGLKCMHSDQRYYWSVVPAALHPRRMSLGAYGRLCEIDDRGLFCSRFEHSSDIVPISFVPKPTLARPQFRLLHARQFLEAVQKGSTGARAALFQAGAEIAKADLAAPERSLPVSHARYLLLSLLRPAIESGDSGYFTQTVNPAFASSISSIEKELGFSGAENISGDSPLNRVVALKVLRSALSSSAPFLSVTDREAMQSSLRGVGTALADPKREENIRDVTAAVEAMEPLLDRLAANPKSAFLGGVIRNAGTWLKGNQ